MEDIFELRFSFEEKTKEEVIRKFSNKQGGKYNIFSFHWQCFVWAAVIGFLRDERRELLPPIADKPFSLNTMRAHDGELDAQALLCMCISKAGSLDILKNPQDAIQMINEYANGGFYHIMKLMENGENTFNDFEKVKQEIFSRNYLKKNQQLAPSQSVDDIEVPEIDDEAIKQAQKDFLEDASIKPKIRQRWTITESKDLKTYFKQGMTIEQLASFFNKSEDNVRSQLEKLGLLE